MPVLIQALFAVFLLCFALYVWIEFRAVRAVRRHGVSGPVLRAQGDAGRAEWPRVSVLLPVYNESAVVERLIDAVAAMQYPRDCIEVLVLDDSDDATTQLAEARVAVHAAEGLFIRLLRRPERSDHKAGNLRNGIRSAHGDFLVIFDADFLPPADFLLRTMSCFDDDNVGYLQTGIGYLNRDANFLTRFQAMIMGHQQYVTQGLSASGSMASLSGSACVWRRACVDELGGWTADTITEDVDLGYRAQFGRWQYAYVPDVVCLSELPERIGEVRVQRDRWARGLIQNAFRYAAALWQPGLPMGQRLQAFSLMFSSLLLAFFTVMLLLALPLAMQAEQLGWFFDVCSAAFVGLLCLWLYSNALGTRAATARLGEAPRPRCDADEPRAKPGRTSLLAYVLMFLPLSLYYFVAALQVAAGRRGGFNRTPKGGPESAQQTPRIERVLRWLEWLALLYALLTLVLSVLALNPWLIAYSAACCGGFGLVIWLDWQQRRRALKGA